MLSDRHDPRSSHRAESRANISRGAAGSHSLARMLARGEARALISCAGQGVAWLPELAQLANEPTTQALLEAAEAVMQELLATREVRWSDLFAQGFELTRWLGADVAEMPDEAYLASTPVSLPGIFIAQIARAQSVARRGLAAAFEAGAIVGLTGYSQGIAAATLLAERTDGGVSVERFAEYLRAITWLAFDVTVATREATQGAASSPMALVVGPDRAAIDKAIAGIEGVSIALANDRRRTALSGTPEGLARAQAKLEQQAQREVEARKAGRHGGPVMTTAWESIATTTAFHSPLVAAGLAKSIARCAGFVAAPLLPVFDPGRTPDEPATLNEHARVTDAMLRSIAVKPGRWQETLLRIARTTGCDSVLDLGPGDGIARLTAGALRGAGIDVHALGASDEDRERFLSVPRAARPVAYGEFSPRLAELPTGAIVVDNAFTRATGTPPVILPGMTPTTVDVPICAAAANAGYTVELAGGGQVSEAVFAARMAELSAALAPGVEVVFNALLLDAYLWGLHLGDKRLVQKSRAAGAPIAGVTVSAGIPQLDDAVRLLDELAALGMRVNAFKPGTRAQIEEVVAIARAAPQHTIFIHIEGGKAGGHHSWEDLDALLLETYHAIRSQPNLVLCVGGGIATEARAVELMLGTWAQRHGQLAMPVDAVFLGTLTMACREASASPSVKAALAAAVGTVGGEGGGWVGRGQVAGGVTSGRSQLDADIHYLENAAARCGRLLDEVAGDAAKVAAKRDEIIAALALTAKPYFGDVEAMTYGALIARMIELMAVARRDGANARYEDGPWLDVTWRTRVFDMVRRAEARLAGIGAGDSESVAPDLTSLDRPHEVLAALLARHPRAATERLHIVDATYFLREVCARPGKPVPFVPVIDQDVRRHYKADSLWQAQDARYPADAVLVIPGPEAVSGVTADEPVATLLGRFDQAIIAALTATGTPARVVDSLKRGPARLATSLRQREHDAPAGVTVGGSAEHMVMRVDDAAAAGTWREWIAGHYQGPLAALVGLSEADGLWSDDRSRLDNPVPRLLAPVVGATLTLRSQAGVLTHILYQPAATEWVALDLARAAMTISLRFGWQPAATSPQTAYELEMAAQPGQHYRFVVAAGAAERAVAQMYQKVLFANAAASVAPFQTASATVPLPPDMVAAYQRVTGRPRPAARPALSQVFSLTWPAIYRTLSCAELGGGLIKLVHLDNRVEAMAAAAAWNVVEVACSARVTRIEDHADHRVVSVRAEVQAGNTLLARLASSFHIRGAFANTTRAHEVIDVVFSLDAAKAEFLRGHDWIVQAGGTIADTGSVRLQAELGEERSLAGAHFTAHGTLGGLGSATIALDVRGGAEHPLRAALTALGVELSGATWATARKTLGRMATQAPAQMDTFAEVGGDHNPIHTRLVAARLAGLAAPIAHGMWTAARLEAFVAETCGDAERLSDIDVKFMAPVLPGERLELSAVRVGLAAGRMVIEASAKRLSGEVVATAKVGVTAPRSAYVFPGQGIQQRDMGMPAMLRSASARKAWERADAFTRGALGFSILRVVRENPRELDVLGVANDRTSHEHLVHPQGVLHLTQLTQVAMAVLAYAQVAELREAGVWRADAALCGHSVGEYNALCAGADVLPLESVIAIVYKRGRVMHGLVPRDASGESGYRMGVIRPHYAGLDHAGAEAMVAGIAAKTGRSLEIVNYNVRGRQYSVTGHADALAILEGLLVARQKPRAAVSPSAAAAAAKPSYIEVPGIDVPFHSRVLRDGVADFRRALDKYLPARIAPEQLVGRYIPNLVAEPFALTPEFVAKVRDNVGEASKVTLQALLDDWEARKNDGAAVTRLLVIELLAWQFASPVRWIETQDVMFSERSQGGLGIEELFEVGVGYQPTLANMARQTLSLGAPSKVVVLNVEAERAVVFAEDADVVVREEVEATAPKAQAAVAAATPVAPVVLMAQVATTATRPNDVALTHAEALTTLIALQTKLRPEQVGPAETIDGLFDGVSSRRNQVLMDLGVEFDAGSIDRAHEVPVSELARELATRAPAWRAPGAYLAGAYGEAQKRVLGRSGLSARDAASYFDATYGFGPGLVTAAFDTLALETRGGASARGGELGHLGDAAPATKDEARALLDGVVGLLGKRRGVSFGRLGAATGPAAGVVDSKALSALEDKLFGKDGALLDAARALAKACGKEIDPGVVATHDERVALIATLERELGEDFIALVQPRFDAHLHVAFESAWAAAQRDLVKIAFDAMNGRVGPDEVDATLLRIRSHAGMSRIAASAEWFARQAEGKSGGAWIAEKLAAFAALGRASSAATRASAASEALALRFAGRVALVTGASPGSIAVEVTRELLAGGAKVVITTTQMSRERLLFYRRLYESCAAPGAELHVVPCNQASFLDIDALVDWLFRAETEQAGASVRVLKPAMAPDIIVPFAALKDVGTVDQLGGTSEATLRAMVLSTERMVALVARRIIASGEAKTCHVLLPLSPNHGAFGGDGAYAESKAALEVMLAKWTSEKHAWGRATTLVGARIGWVRGTGLMAQNDAVAPGLEAATGIKTWSSPAMGSALAELLTDDARTRAENSPLVVDLSGGFDTVPDLKGAVDDVRRAATESARHTQAVAALFATEAALLTKHAKANTKVTPLPAWPAASAPEPTQMTWPKPVTAALEDLVVIVGFGEIGPGGSARTRYELEVYDRLSAPAVLELAWLTGLIRYESSGRGGHWLDIEKNEVVAEADIHQRYHDVVRARVGVRFTEAATVGFDAERTPVYEKVFLERDFSFVVGSEAEAKSFAASDPERTLVTRDADSDSAWRVTRKAGSELRVPREARLTRRVAGQVPTGFSLARYGFAGEMLENVDPVALMNLAATVEAFVAAGTTPEELLAWVHPARIGTTQGSGMGGMKSLHRLYVDHILGRERQSDVLQETLINVVFAYATSAYVGSYGPMAHPVAACATAALSLEDAVDKIMLGKVDVVMAGGWDDLSAEGVIGFGDMNATAETDKMLAMGLAPDQMSRANDRRRRGFVESQGGGAMLLARGDVARDMGLPVYAVLGYAASFGDGINRSIPAPGIGSLASVIGGQRSPLAKALTRLGLGADDIALVSKHDTSTAANDPNESGIHQTIQTALGRTPGNPLLVVSQKTVMGHSKGGAAAWQTIGLCQMLAGGEVPGNRNLESLDPALAAHEHLLYTNEPLSPGPAMPLRAGLATSLGFGHVSALLLIVHPACFEAALPEAERATWRAKSDARKADAKRRWTEVLLGRASLYDKRTDRRFAADDGSDSQRREETAMLLDPDARFDAERGVFVSPSQSKGPQV